MKPWPYPYLSIIEQRAGSPLDTGFFKNLACEYQARKILKNPVFMPFPRLMGKTMDAAKRNPCLILLGLGLPLPTPAIRRGSSKESELICDGTEISIITLNPTKKTLMKYLYNLFKSAINTR